MHGECIKLLTIFLVFERDSHRVYLWEVGVMVRQNVLVLVELDVLYLDCFCPLLCGSRCDRVFTGSHGKEESSCQDIRNGFVKLCHSLFVDLFIHPDGECLLVFDVRYTLFVTLVLVLQHNVDISVWI